MKEVLEFIDNAGVYYLATSKDNKPYVRPFGTINLFENKLYIQTGKVKNCFKEIMDNPYVEISAFKDGKWIRVSGKLELDDRIEAKKSMLDKYPNLRSMYNELDDNTMDNYLKYGFYTVGTYSTDFSTKTIYLGQLSGNFLPTDNILKNSQTIYETKRYLHNLRHY